MEKKVLTEQAMYYGDVTMPKGFEINPLNLINNFFNSLYQNKKFIYCKDFDKLNTYIKDFILLKHDIRLVNKDSWTNAYTPNEQSEPLLHIDPVDLKNSADFVLLYGINTVDCDITIFYDDNRRKGRSWNIKLTDNKFIMFPSTNLYCIKNNQKNSLNFVKTITYEFI
tara:strand:+ start:1769 stop:2272 length:504 start_codon:yes stop_codon:yes gene_type:complete